MICFRFVLDDEDPILGYLLGRIQHSFIHILGKLLRFNQDQKAYNL
uniref:Uncharacterized protein n=1 Tax=Cucumis melo TaxID=3656 RepID=A0A9I9E674_CUCME